MEEEESLQEPPKGVDLRTEGLGEALWETDKALGWLEGHLLMNVLPELGVKCSENCHGMWLEKSYKSKTILGSALSTLRLAYGWG